MSWILLSLSGRSHIGHCTSVRGCSVNVGRRELANNCHAQISGRPQRRGIGLAHLDVCHLVYYYYYYYYYCHHRVHKTPGLKSEDKNENAGWLLFRHVSSRVKARYRNGNIVSINTNSVWHFPTECWVGGPIQKEILSVYSNITDCVRWRSVTWGVKMPGSTRSRLPILEELSHPPLRSTYNVTTPYVFVCSSTLPSNRQHQSYGDCLEGKRGDYLTSSVLLCIVIVHIICTPI